MLAMDSNLNLEPNIAFYWRWGVPIFSATALLSLWLSNINIQLFQWLNHFLSPMGNQFWSHLTMLGDTSLGLLLILPFVGRRPDIVWKFVLAALFASMWSHGLKSIFSSLRPAGILPLDSFNLIGPMLEHNAFPSGHTTTIFVLAGLLCLHPVSERLKWAALTLAFTVGLSRIACGAHWPLDVLGGMLGGWLSAVCGVYIAKRTPAIASNSNFQRSVAAILIVAAFWTVFFYDSHFPNTQLFLVTIAVLSVIFAMPGVFRVWFVREKCD
jgi:membrane-associated phospholipid phosphatase